MSNCDCVMNSFLKCGQQIRDTKQLWRQTTPGSRNNRFIHQNLLRGMAALSVECIQGKALDNSRSES